MTVITYSNGVGKLQNKILVLEHPLACKSVPDPLSELLEPGTVLDFLKIQECYGVKHIKRTEKKNNIREQSIQRKFQTMSRGIDSDGKEHRKDVKGCLKFVKGEDKRETDLTGLCSCREKSEILHREKRTNTKQIWLIFSLSHQSINEEKNRMNFLGLRWHKVLPFLALLFLSFYPRPASSQVRVFFRNSV